MEENDDLLLELESVQRAVLYHCPALLEACIVPSVMRMPLLLVEAPEESREDIYAVLQRVVEELVNVPAAVEGGEDGRFSYRKGSVNDYGVQPLMLNFEGLEVEDGEQVNEVLYAVGKEGRGTSVLREVVTEIRSRIEGELGYTTALPVDRPQVKKGGGEEGWRPRVPFMRLPQNFVERLPDPPASSRDGYTVDEGGNGISPAFWFKYWEDAFTKGDGVRLRDIAIYPRMTVAAAAPCSHYTERDYYVPLLKVALPQGNALLTDSEIFSKNYARSGEENDLSRVQTVPSSFSSSAVDSSSLYTLDAPSVQPSSSQPQPKTITSSSTIRSPPLNNTIPKLKSLERLREKQEQRKTAHRKIPSLPPYPSNPHFIGVWRLILSSSGEEQIEPDSNDNIILRVDGTVAGGPVLESVLRQKAAGGKWKFFQAVYVGDDSTESSPEDIRTRLRMQLLVPPTKTQQLVLEGEVTRLVMPSKQQRRTTDYYNFLRKDEEAEEEDDGMHREETFLHVNGEVWIEDNDVEDTRRRKMGYFTAIKLQTPDPERLRYTIPPPKRRLQ